MNTSYTEQLKEVGALNYNDTAIIETVSVYHPTGGSINIVNDREPFVGWADPDTYFSKVYYDAGTFTISLPQSNSEGVSFVNIAFPNIDGKASKFLKSIPIETTEPITLVYRIYLGSKGIDIGQFPTDVYYQGYARPQNNPVLTVQVLSVEISPFQINARATFRSLVNAKYPSELYTLEEHPALGN